MFGWCMMNSSWLKNRKVDVYCLFRNDGIMLPIRIRLFDEDGERQDFSIHRYKIIDGAGQGNSARTDMYKRSTVFFDCVIEVFGQERIIRLMYTSKDMQWQMVHFR